jgi:hypothetical protein
MQVQNGFAQRCESRDFRFRGKKLANSQILVSRLRRLYASLDNFKRAAIPLWRTVSLARIVLSAGVGSVFMMGGSLLVVGLAFPADAPTISRLSPSRAGPRYAHRKRLERPAQQQETPAGYDLRGGGGEAIPSPVSRALAYGNSHLVVLAYRRRRGCDAPFMPTGQARGACPDAPHARRLDLTCSSC